MGRGFAPRESDDTAVVPPIYHERGAEAPIENLGGRCSVSAHFSRAPAWLCRTEWGRGCAPQKSDDTEVVPPVLLRARRVSAQRNPLEGDAPSAPTSPARQRGFIGGMGAGLRPAEVGRHGGRPSSFVTSAARERPAKSPGGRCSVGAHFSRAPARLCQMDGCGAAPRRSRTTRRSSLQFCYERGAGAE